MVAYIGIALCFIPLIICGLVSRIAFDLKFKYQLIAVLLGLVAVFPISAIQYFLPVLPILQGMPVFHSLLRSLFLYGLVEEVIKMLLLLPLPHKDFTPLKFLLLSFVAGLALGCFESTVYYFEHLQRAASRGADLLYGQILLRIITSDIIHMTCTGLCGMFIYSCRNKPRNIWILVLAILLHGFYDFFAGFSNNFRWFAIPVILLAIIECRLKYVSIQNLCENRLTVFY